MKLSIKIGLWASVLAASLGLGVLLSQPAEAAFDPNGSFSTVSNQCGTYFLEGGTYYTSAGVSLGSALPICPGSLSTQNGASVQLGVISAYNGLYTVANGVPSIIAKADALAQAANVSSSTLFATNGTGSGMYRASCYVVVTQAATSSSTLPSCTFGWTDKDSATAVTVTPTSTQTGNTVGTLSQGAVVINAAPSSNITWSTGSYAASGTTTMQYAVHAKLESIGN